VICFHTTVLQISERRQLRQVCPQCVRLSPKHQGRDDDGLLLGRRAAGAARADLAVLMQSERNSCALAGQALASGMLEQSSDSDRVLRRRLLVGGGSSSGLAAARDGVRRKAVPVATGRRSRRQRGARRGS